MELVGLNQQYKFLEEKIDRRIKSVLDHGQYIMGPEVYEFEELLADYVGVKHCVSCANGTDALQLSLMALDIKEGDAVFCPAFTFFATAEAIAIFGATPVFVDSDPLTFNVCPVDLEKKIKTVIDEGKVAPKAILAVDLFGLPADYDRLKEIAKNYRLLLLEDAAQGMGGEIYGRRAGSFGDLATTSFFPTKPLGCYGDGGAVFTDNDEYASLVRSLRAHGKGSSKYDNLRVGMNSRLDTIQAAILLEKLDIFSIELEHRNNVAKKYNDIFDSIFECPYIPKGYKSSYAQYTIKTEKRLELIKFFEKKGIPSAVYYDKPAHQQLAFARLDDDRCLPIAEKLSTIVLSIPMHSYISDEDIRLVEKVFRQGFICE